PAAGPRPAGLGTTAVAVVPPATGDWCGGGRTPAPPGQRAALPADGLRPAGGHRRAAGGAVSLSNGPGLSAGPGTWSPFPPPIAATAQRPGAAAWHSVARPTPPDAAPR